MVTEVDRASEARIVEMLLTQTPDHGFLTEEAPSRASRSGARWIIDPLDGTTNFAHGYARFCVSIALERDGELELGVVYDPLRNELFVALRDAGATLNGKPIRVGTAPSLAQALVATGFPYDAWEIERDNAAEVAYFIKRVRSLRSGGAAALDLADLACGRLDGFWEPDLLPYDTAAGIVLLREAGGVATDYAGGPDAVYSSEIVAGNRAIHAEMLAYLKERHLPKEA